MYKKTTANSIKHNTSMNKADQKEEKANIIQELKQNHTCTHTGHTYK